MSKLKLFAFAACLALAPISASIAGAPDYAKKKAGGVSFSNDKEQETTAAAPDAEPTHPSQIEPAAGGYDAEDTKEEKSLADDMKLPRK